MIRNPKALLLAGLAVLVMSAIGASTAQANLTTEHTEVTTFTNVEGGNTTLTTDQDGTGTTAHHVFDVPGNGAITCNAADLEGTVTGVNLSAVSLKAKGSTPFTGCTFLGQPATVELNGCGFEFQPPTTVQVTCPGTNTITFSAGGCTVHVSPQHLTEAHQKYRNLGSGIPGTEMWVTAQVDVTNIKSNATGAGCITAGESTTGRYTTGNTLITGELDPPNTPNATRKPVTVH